MDPEVSNELIKNYIIRREKKLGTGLYGQVFQAHDKKKGTEVAVKIVDKNKLNINQKQAIEDEIFITQKIKTQNILEMHGAFENKEQFYIFMEKCDGNLKEQLKRKQSHTWKENISILAQIVQGLCDLAKEKFIHRELNPDNILTKGNKIKLASNGHFKFFLKQLTDGSRNIHYVSPQILRQRPYSSKTDIFSLGVIAFQLFQGGELPWGSYTQKEQYLQAIKNDIIIKKPIPKYCENFLRGCLQFYQKDRLSLQDVANHQMFKIHTDYRQIRLDESSDCLCFLSKYFTLDDCETRAEYIQIIDSLSKNQDLPEMIDATLKVADIQQLDEDAFFAFLYLCCLKNKMKVGKKISQSVFIKLDIDESLGISKQQIITAIKDREEEINTMMHSQLRRVFAKIYMYLQKNSEMNLRTMFDRFADEDEEDAFIMKIDGFLDMMDMYEKWMDGVIIPLDIPTKIRIFDKMKPDSEVDFIKYSQFRQLFVRTLNLPKDYPKKKRKNWGDGPKGGDGPDDGGNFADDLLDYPTYNDSRNASGIQ